MGLIQYWADAFKGRPELSAVEELYDQMKSGGTEFPPIDLDTLAPIETPSNRVRLLIASENVQNSSISVCYIYRFS